MTTNSNTNMERIERISIDTKGRHNVPDLVLCGNQGAHLMMSCRALALAMGKMTEVSLEDFGTGDLYELRTQVWKLAEHLELIKKP